MYIYTCMYVYIHRYTYTYMYVHTHKLLYPITNTSISKSMDINS